MNDAELLRRFEDLTLPFEHWRHRTPIKVAYLYIRQLGLEEAIPMMRKNIQAYNAANDVPEGLDRGYHETLTQAWLRIIHAMIQSQGAEPTADEFCDKQGYLMHKLLLRLYYTRPRIMSLEAKHGWVEPDLSPLPVVGEGPEAS